MRKFLPPLDAVPPFLRLQARWVVWTYAERGEKLTKVPMVAEFEKAPASVNDPSTWRSLYQALEVAEGAPWAAGVGVVLGDGLVGVDLDGVVHPGGLSPLAEEVLSKTRTYAELSPSGKGLHLFVLGEGRSFRRGPVEVYAGGRYFTFTGEALPGREGFLEDQPFLDWLWERFGKEAASSRAAPHRAAPRSREAPLSVDEEAVVERVLRSRYAPLWRGDWEAMGYRSQSEADLALAGYLLALTGGDMEAADRLFRRSGLYRPKWDEKRGALTYGERTLRKAASR